MSSMTPDQVRRILLNNERQRLRITFSDGVVQTVDVTAVDDEGFLHSGPDGENPSGFWTRFESVVSVNEV